jgi:predicted DsbA family dithiol-disulfide isomerase
MVGQMVAIEVYADIWCPFAHVGLRMVARRRKQLGRDDLILRIRAWPLELVNGAPLDRAATAQHVDDLRSQVAPDLFAGFDADTFPRTSLPALALAAAAYRQDERTGEVTSLALRDALFEDGRDISNPEVLRRVALAHGVPEATSQDEAAVQAEWVTGQARGVKGSPHFFCGESDAFCPSLHIAKDEDGHLHLRRDMQALDGFLDDCFKL